MTDPCLSCMRSSPTHAETNAGSGPFLPPIAPAPATAGRNCRRRPFLAVEKKTTAPRGGALCCCDPRSPPRTEPPLALRAPAKATQRWTGSGTRCCAGPGRGRGRGRPKKAEPPVEAGPSRTPLLREKGVCGKKRQTNERAVRVACEAVGAEGMACAHHSPGVRADDRSTSLGCGRVWSGAYSGSVLSLLCGDATRVSPLTRTGQPQPCTADVDGASLRTTERRKATTYLELRSEGIKKARRAWQRAGRRASTATHSLCYETWFNQVL